ncbi:cupin domain-containing protein [Chryseobacterium sp.]|uniref:cupin domain-containing protein n=1 Tax=Chryseobacterium sp. TaxID=1871047 RepID=UPI0025BBD9E9|nr:cupin domain-containing protein [Chryseobacterium sp.]
MKKSKENSEYYQWGDHWILRDSPQLSVKRKSMSSPTAEKTHFHEKAEQAFYILKGKAVFHLNNERYIMREGESICILPKTVHYISNESDDLLDFLAVSSSTTKNDRVLI